MFDSASRTPPDTEQPQPAAPEPRRGPPPELLQRKLARRRKDGPALQSLSEIKTDIKDGAEILWELGRLSQFHLQTGTFEGDLDIGKAAYYCQLVHPGGVFGMLDMDVASRGSNMVHLVLNVYQKSFALSAATLHLNGFRSASFSSRACTLNAVSISGSASGAALTVGSASMDNGVFVRGKDRADAANVGLTGLRSHALYDKTAGGQAALASMNFDEAHVHGLHYPGLPPTDMTVRQAGLTIDLLWTALSPGGPSTAALPQAPDVLPKDSHIDIDLGGLAATASVNLDDPGAAAGAGGFVHFHVKLLGGDGAELAAIVVDGFHSSGAASGGAGSIDNLSVRGQPALVKYLLNADQVQAQPKVRQALDVIKACGIQPVIGGTLNLQHVGVSAGKDGKATARGDLAASFAVPDVGALDLALHGFAADLDQKALSGSFDQLTARLADQGGKELAFAQVDGGAAAQSADQGASGGASSFVVRGDVAALLKAAGGPLQQLPPQVRGALAALQKLGVKGQLSGGLHGSAAAGDLAIGGDLNLKLDAGATGSVALTLKGFHGDDQGGSAGGSFTRLEARLLSKDKEAAFLGMDNAAASEKGKSLLFQAKHVEVRGDTSSLTRLLAALEKNAATLPAAARSACATARRDLATFSAFGVDGQGSAALDNVSGAADGTAAQARTDLHAGFALAGVGQVSVVLRGFSGSVSPTAKEVHFDAFTATLSDAKGAQAAHLLIEGSQDRVAGASAHFHAQKVQADGSSTALASLFTGIEQHLKALPQQVVQAFDVVRAHGAELAARGSLSMSDVDLGSADGKVVARGDVSAQVVVPEVGTLEARLLGSRAGDHPGFDSLDLRLCDARGAEAAALHAGGVAIAAGGAAAKVATLSAHGDGTRLHALLDGKVRALLPQQIAQALALLDGDRLALALNNLSVQQGADGSIAAGAETVVNQAAIHFVDAQGAVYACPDATLMLSGAKVQLGADHKPLHIAAAAMSASGHFTSKSKGGSVQGTATLRSGAVKIEMGPGGTPRSVVAQDIHASGTVHTTQPAAHGVAPPLGKDQQIAAVRGSEPLAEEAARLIKSADIHTQTPLRPGRYGGSLIHIGVVPGSTLNINLVARDNALSSGTDVEFRPPLDLPAWLALRGVNLEVQGTQGVLKTDLKGFFNFNLSKYVSGQKNMALDLSTLVHQVMDQLQRTLADAKEPTEESTGSSMADLASPKGMDLLGTTGTADIELAAPRRDASLEGVTVPAGSDLHLHGQSQGGGRISLTADEIAVAAGGNQITAAGLSTGAVRVASGDDGSQIQFNSFSLKQLRWDALSGP